MDSLFLRRNVWHQVSRFLRQLPDKYLVQYLIICYQRVLSPMPGDPFVLSFPNLTQVTLVDAVALDLPARGYSCHKRSLPHFFRGNNHGSIKGRQGSETMSHGRAYFASWKDLDQAGTVQCDDCCGEKRPRDRIEDARNMFEIRIAANSFGAEYAAWKKPRFKNMAVFFDDISPEKLL